MIRWAIARPGPIAALVVAIVVTGTIALIRLPLSASVDIELPRLDIYAAWPGSTAELVEGYVCVPIEAAVQLVKGVLRSSSEATDGGCSIEVELAPEADVQVVRLGILERLEALRGQLPAGSSQAEVTNAVPDEFDEAPLLQYSMFGPISESALTDLARAVVLPRVLAVAGVGSARIVGGIGRSISITYDRARLAEAGLGGSDVARALQAAQVQRSVGFVRSNGARVPVTATNRLADIAAIETLPIRGETGIIARLGSVAAVRESDGAEDGFYRINGRPAVSVVVWRLPGADAIATASNVRRAVGAAVSTLPQELEVRLVADESREIAVKLATVGLRSIFGIGLIGVVVLVFYGSYRSSIVVVGSIAWAAAGTALTLYVLRLPVNMLTFAGMAMGMSVLVRNSILVVDSLRCSGEDAGSRYLAVTSVSAAVLGGTGCSLALLLPFMYIQGEARGAFEPFAVSFAFALLWSVLYALFVVPTLDLSPDRATSGARLGLWYSQCLRALIRSRSVVLLCWSLCIALALWAGAKRVATGRFYGGAAEQTTLDLRVSFPRGSDVQGLDQTLSGFEALSRDDASVDLCIVQGSLYAGSLHVVFDPAAAAGSAPYLLQQKLTSHAVGIGGATISIVGRGPGFATGGGLATVPLQIKVLGYSYEGVLAIANDVKRRLMRVPRVQNVDINAGRWWRRDHGVDIALSPRRETLAGFGMTVADFAEVVGREVRGPITRQLVSIDGEERPYSVKAADAENRDVAALSGAVVRASRTSVPFTIGAVSDVHERQAVSEITREDQQFRRVVSYEFRGTGRLAQRSHESFIKSLHVEPGFSISDESSDPDETSGRSALAAAFGFGGVLLVLVVAIVFDSIWAGVFAMLAVPSALAGAVAALWVGAMPLDREAAIGMVVLLGLAMQQTIVVVEYLLVARRIGTTEELIIEYSQRALRVSIVTSLASIAGLVPFLVGLASPQLAVTAVSVLGGAIGGGLFALFILPVAAAKRFRFRRSATAGT